MHNSKHSVDIYIMDNCDSAMIVGNMGPLCPAGRSSFSIWSCRTGLAPKIDDCTPPLLMVFCYLPSSNVNVFIFFFTTNALWQWQRQQCDDVAAVGQSVKRFASYYTQLLLLLLLLLWVCWPLSPDCYCTKPQMEDQGGVGDGALRKG